MKKINYAIILAILISVCSFNGVFAIGNNEKIQDLKTKNYIQGTPSGELLLKNSITRAQAIKLIVLANGDKDVAMGLQNTKSKYIDVNTDYWANGFINAASTNPIDCNGQFIVHGYPCGKFLPDRNLSCAEFAKMLVILTDNTMTSDKIKEIDKMWPNSWIDEAKDKNIFNGINVPYENDEVNREIAFVMFYNALHNINLI